jgi:DNA polymerase III alpha subunit
MQLRFAEDRQGPRSDSSPQTMCILATSDHDAHDVIFASAREMVQDGNRKRRKPELYFKSPEEMREIFRDFRKRREHFKIAKGAIWRLNSENRSIPEYPSRGFHAKRIARSLREGLQRYSDRADHIVNCNNVDYELGGSKTGSSVTY